MSYGASKQILYASVVAEFFGSWKSPYTSVCMRGSKQPVGLAAVWGGLLLGGSSFSEMAWVLLGSKWL